MPEKNIFMQFVTLVGAQSADGVDYTDKRADYVGRPGFLVISEEDSDEFGNDNGHHMIFNVLDRKKNLARIETSHGQFNENETMGIFRSTRSIYLFKKKYELSMDDEQLLFDLVTAQIGVENY